MMRRAITIAVLAFPPEAANSALSAKGLERVPRPLASEVLTWTKGS